MMVENKDIEKIKNIKKFNFLEKKAEIPTNNMESKLCWGEYQKPSPFLSIIIPTYKRPILLQQTLNSILEQNVLYNYEIIICDNEGIDEVVGVTETENMIRQLNCSKIVYYRNFVNDPSNWNICIKKAKGEWLCMVHDDDILLQGHLGIMHEIVLKNPQIQCLGCLFKEFRQACPSETEKKALLTKNTVKYVFYDEFMYGMPVSLLGAFFRRDLAIQLGGFDLVSYIGDCVFMAKYAYHFNVYRCNKQLYGYRISLLQDSANNQMNAIRRVSDYYLWRSIAEKGNSFLKPILLKKCQYNLVNRILEYNKDKHTYGVREINLQTICHFCEIDITKHHDWEKYLLKVCRGIFILARACFLKTVGTYKINK